MPTLPLRPQHKWCDGRFEAVAVNRHKEVMPTHDAHGGFERRVTAVFKGLAGLEQGLLPDGPQTIDGVDVAVRVLDVPVPGDQLCGDLTRVVDGDGVSKNVERLRGVGLFR